VGYKRKMHRADAEMILGAGLAAPKPCGRRLTRGGQGARTRRLSPAQFSKMGPEIRSQQLP
jgi:hypothetical protein